MGIQVERCGVWVVVLMACWSKKYRIFGHHSGPVQRSPAIHILPVRRQCRRRRRACAALLMAWFSLAVAMDGRGFRHRVLPTKRSGGAADGICKGWLPLQMCWTEAIDLCGRVGDSRKCCSLHMHQAMGSPMLLRYVNGWDCIRSIWQLREL